MIRYFDGLAYILPRAPPQYKTAENASGRGAFALLPPCGGVGNR